MQKKRIVLVKMIKQKEDKFELKLLDGKSDRIDYTGRILYGKGKHA